MAEKIIQKDVYESYKEDMVTYSISVNRRRSIPEVRDGLKPVQRRIIYSMFELGAFSHSTQRKSSKVVGDTMGNYHPHGDSSIYGAMTPLGNWWECKMPILSLDGNWGNFMGDGPAAMRYTEAAISKFGYEALLEELAETNNVVDWSKSHDEKRLEPDFLPNKVPLVLINGASGIGVGMSCNIPKHNMHEVINATKMILKANKESIIESEKAGYYIPPRDVDIVLIPDHCLPCKIIDTDWRAIANSGTGKYKVRGVIDIIEYEKHPALVVRSLPDGVTTDQITDTVSKIVLNKELPMVKNMIDTSGAGQMSIIIQLKKGSDPYYVRDVLYKRTLCQKSCTVNFEIVNGLNPIRLNYKQYLQMFIEQRTVTKFRLYCNKLQKVMTRWHKLDAYIKAIETGDEVINLINLIRKQKTIDDTELIERLIKKLNITDLQAKFIINANIKQLSTGYLTKYKAEAEELWKLKTEYETKINNKNLLLDEIEEELDYFDKKYPQKRQCTIVKLSDESNIPEGTFKLVITENNYIRKLVESENPVPVGGDKPKFIIRIDNRDSVLLFDHMGKVFRLPVHKIPVTERGNAGIDIRMIIKGATADIIYICQESVIKFISAGQVKHFITVVTARNYIKKLDVDDFLTIPVSGIFYTKLTQDDFVKSIAIIPDTFDIIIYSGYKALRVSMSEIPNYKRASQGVYAMNTNDFISGLAVLYPNSNYVVVLTRNGKANKFDIAGLDISSRNRAGSQVIRLGKGDEIMSIYGANDNNTLRVICEQGDMLIKVSDIPVSSSVSSGIKMITTKSNRIIKSDLLA